jgi:hypothetical protein
MATEFRENAHVAMMLLGYPGKLINLYNINPFQNINPFYKKWENI